jgi:hypothetical protein
MGLAASPKKSGEVVLILPENSNFAGGKVFCFP